MTQRPHFRDPDLDRRYDEVGFVVVRGLARDAVRPLREAHRRLMGTEPSGFHSTPYLDDTDQKRAVNEEIQRHLGPLADRLLSDHRLLLASFISKRRGDDSRMPPHMDWTFVEEPEHASMNFWVPLVDVRHRNGAMSLLPGSHRVPFTIRGSGTSNPYAEVEAEAAARMVEVPMRAGDVLVHDHRVLHSSPPNRSRRLRLVAGMAIVAAGSPAVHYAQGDDGALVRHALDDRFFTDHTYGGDLPDSARPVGTVRFTNPTFTVADLPPSTDRSTVS